MRLVVTTIFVFLVLLTMTTSLMAEVSIEIVSPSDGAHITPCETHLVQAKVTTTAGEAVKYVYFYANGKTLRRLKREPWEFDWKKIKKGAYQMVAKVQLEDGTEVWSESIRFKVGSVSSGEKLYSGGFDCGTLAPWTGQLAEDAAAQFVVYEDPYFDDPFYLTIEISNGGSAEWHIQLSQDCPTDSGHVYTIAFLADSDDQKTIVVGMQEGQEPWATQLWQPVDIDGVDEYSLEFTAMKTDPTNVLRFNVGGNTIPFYLDDVRVVDRSATSVKSQQFDLHGAVSSFELFQAYPNPFNLSTTIRFTLSGQADVQLAVYNMNGQKIRTLVAENRAAGAYAVLWDGLNDYAHVVPSGLYVYRLTGSSADGHAVDLSRKMLLLK